MLNINDIRCVSATLDDYPILQNMANYYAYDISEYMGWAQEENGTHSIGIDFIKYWHDEHAFPFLIKHMDELVGFVIIDKKVSDSLNDFNMAQFFILRKFTGKGIGRRIAIQCFAQFHGRWEVFVMKGNTGAYRFWKKIISHYTDQQFNEYPKTVNGFDRHVFEFSSQRHYTPL